MNVEFYYVAFMVEKLLSHPLSYEFHHSWLWNITNRSDEKGLEHGVPQGSILRSLLSIVMANKPPSFDCRVHTVNTQSVLYADYNTVFNIVVEL